MSSFFTADHHFGHENIIKFCNRPFTNAHEMDRFMIDAWNAVVGPDDIVYHLGDFTLTGSLFPWLNQLHFRRLFFVPGGHDHRWVGECDKSRPHNIEVLPPLVTLELEDPTRYIVLCHYPMLSWDRSHYGSLHLHGHTHGTILDSLSDDTKLPPGQMKGKRIDVGVDHWNFAPVSLEQLL